MQIVRYVVVVVALTWFLPPISALEPEGPHFNLNSVEAAAFAQEQSYQVPASPKGKAAGTSHYEVRETATQHVVRIVGENGAVQGLVTITTGQDVDRAIRLETPEGVELRIHVSPDMRGVEIQEPAAGLAGRSRFDVDTKTFAKDEAFVTLEKKRRAELNLALEAASQVLDYHKRQLEKNGPPSRCQPAPSLDGKANAAATGGGNVATLEAYGDPQFCQGTRCRGWSWSLSQSGCCAAAEQDAHACCGMNAYCIGCCNIGQCDYFCTLGDGYLCPMCGVTGTACSGDPTRCLEDWQCPPGTSCRLGTCMQDRR